MDDVQLDARRWCFLDKPENYIQGGTTGLQVEPLMRQFRTAKEILSRLKDGRGVLLADDVGLGKTTVGALVAWTVASQDKRVRIYAPNEVLRRRWAEELERHIPMLPRPFNASSKNIKQGHVEKLRVGRIQVTTHYELVKSHKENEQRTACDLMIVDEAHRAKGEGSAFNEALTNLGKHAKRKLILTATPFSIRLAELEQLLNFVGATEIGAVHDYAKELERLYTLGKGHDVSTEGKQLVDAARKAIAALKPYVIRHCIDDLSSRERVHFGAVGSGPWEIPTPPATDADLSLLLRMDRILQLTQERKGDRRNDPRFHIGWQHVSTELDRTINQISGDKDHVVAKHIKAAQEALRVRLMQPHPKAAAVSEALKPLLNAGEKVVVFCHHLATAGELLGVLEQSLKAEKLSPLGPDENVWREAWKLLFPQEDCLVAPIVDWLCSRGLRWQVGGWLGKPADTAEDLAKQLEKTKPRNVNSSCRVPSIFESARNLADALLNKQSKSTLKILRNIMKDEKIFGGKVSHFPGRLDDGFRTMGVWNHNSHSPLETLYTGRQPDIVLEVFNSPFGPDVLVTTDRLSEGVDLHRCCRHLVHYELDPSPVRTLQRNGRIRRVESWAAITSKPIMYAYPKFSGTRDEKAVAVMKQRIDAFGLLLGGVPSLDADFDNSEQSFVEDVLCHAGKKLKRLNRELVPTPLPPPV